MPSSLAQYALTVRDEFLPDYVGIQQAATLEAGTPMTRHLTSLPPEQIVEMARAGAHEFLSFLGEERHDEYIEISLGRWSREKAGVAGNVKLEAADITAIAYSRKQALLALLPRYTLDLSVSIDIIGRLDRFLHRYETAALERLSWHHDDDDLERRQFIERVSAAVPGALYVFDVERMTFDYVNTQLAGLLGYEANKLSTSTWDALKRIIHAEDHPALTEYFTGFGSLADGRTFSQKYRALHSNGSTIWLRSYDTPFRRSADGALTHTIGFCFDITTEKMASEELKEKERLYREAQSIARMGSWMHELGSTETFWSDELLRIYGLNETAGMRSREEMRRHMLPEDREAVRHVIDDALTRDAESFEARYRIRTASGDVKHLQSRGTFVRDADGTPTRVVGTVQDLTEEQTMIDRLAESKTRYKEAQALARIGNWTHDYVKGTRYWSDEMSRIFGVEPSLTPPSAQEFSKLIHPADRQRLLQRHRVMAEKPGTYTGEYRVGIGRESQQWVRMRTESVAGEDGQIVALRGTVQDITQEKSAEWRALQQQTFIRKITDLAPSVITVFDASAGAYEFVNEGLTALLGYEAEAMLHGGPGFVLERCHPDDVPAIQALAARVLSAPVTMPDGAPAEAVHEGRYRLRNAEGEYRWLHTYATIFSRAEDGSVAKTLDISLDVTEQVNAEAFIREQEHFVRNVTQLVPSVITVVDLETMKYVFVNETGATILGQPIYRFYEEGFDFINSLAHPDDLPAMAASVEKSIRDANAWTPGSTEPLTEAQYRIRCADGQYRWMRSLTTPFLRGADGSVQQLISITQDVTPLHEAEELLKQRAALLQQSNQSLEEFAYVASHDLQEPLRKISTFGEMLSRSESVRGDERGLSLLGKMTDSAKRMQTLINDLLDISVISRQKGFETAKLSILLREVLQTLEHKIESTGAVITADKLPDVVVIPAQMRQLFQNLISNAIKFRKADEAPRIDITTRTLLGADAQAHGLLGHQPHCEIRFADQGIGFSNEYAEKIFTIFQRLHGKAEYDGSGIGLAICRRIVEHHGGRIWASGEVGEGSVFTVVLPV